MRSNVSGDTVTIDGRTVGPTGPEAHELAPGKHTIRVEKAGFEPFETRVTLTAGGEESIPAHLTVALEPGETFRDRLKDGSLGPKMVVIPAGKFPMGSPEDEKGRDSDEGPQHRVRISKAFALGVTEVTVTAFRGFVEGTGYRTSAEQGDGCYAWTGSSWELDKKLHWRKPGFEQGGDHPVVCVSWRDATAYAKWLSGQTGEDYRLPTEAEWEYATRAGTNTRYYWGNEEEPACRHANCCDTNCEYPWKSSCDDGYKNTAPVGRFQPNGFGLFDTSGNVWEWTADCWHGDYENAPEDGRAWGEEDGGNCARRVLRGGSWSSKPRRLRSADRSRGAPDDRNDRIGFRLARAL